MGVAGALPPDDAVVRIFNRKPGRAGAEGRSDLHTLQDEIDTETVLPLHTLLIGADIVLFPHALFRPLDGDLMVAGEGLHPTVILVGPLAQNVFGDGAGLVYVAKEMDDILRPGQQGNVAQNDDAVKNSGIQKPAGCQTAL